MDDPWGIVAEKMGGGGGLIPPASPTPPPPTSPVRVHWSTDSQRTSVGLGSWYAQSGLRRTPGPHVKHVSWGT